MLATAMPSIAITENRLHRMRVDGTDLEMIGDFALGHLHFTIVDSWIYYSLASDSAFNVNLHRMRPNGAEAGVIVDADVRHYDVVDNWIFYSGSGAFNLYRFDLNNGETIQISDVFFSNGFLIYEDWIYYLDGTDFGSTFEPLRRMRFDGTNIQTIIDNSEELTQIFEEFWIPVVPVGI
ncbi:MAG: DUF5050 domain-containing protein [Defluviitaleaceae bacterium]|nr:DUF5050 domain-containing protein [Defluviitaleaceae bacterium]